MDPIASGWVCREPLLLPGVNLIFIFSILVGEAVNMLIVSQLKTPEKPPFKTLPAVMLLSTDTTK